MKDSCEMYLKLFFEFGERVQKKSQTTKCPQARQGSTETLKSSESPADSYLPAQTHSRACALSDMGVPTYFNFCFSLFLKILRSICS